jgi:hypothetical protein
MSAFVIPQVPGSIKRSHPVDGVAESLVKSKKYLVPMTLLAPELTGGAVVAYLADGRMKLPKDATVFKVDDPAADPADHGPQGMPIVPAALGADTSPASAPPSASAP